MATILTQPGNEQSATQQLRHEAATTGTLFSSRHSQRCRGPGARRRRHRGVDRPGDREPPRTHRVYRHDPPGWLVQAIGQPNRHNHTEWLAAAETVATFQDRWAPGNLQPLHANTPPAAQTDLQTVLANIHQLNTRNHNIEAGVRAPGQVPPIQITRPDCGLDR